MLSRMALQLSLLLLGRFSPTCQMSSLCMQSCISSGTAVLTVLLLYLPVGHYFVKRRTLFLYVYSFSICLVKPRGKKSHLCFVRFRKEGVSADNGNSLAPYILVQTMFFTSGDIPYLCPVSRSQLNF